MKKITIFLMVFLLSMGGAIFAADDDTLLISGQIALTNSEEGFSITLADIKSMIGTTYVVNDPWMGENFYQGVKLIDLLEYVGYPANAEEIVLVCSDDKEFVVKVEDAEKYPIMLAYATRGRDLPKNQGGPLKLVYPINKYPEIEETYPSDDWAWYIVELRVEM